MRALRAENNPAASPSACLLLLAGFLMLAWVCSPTVEGSWPWTPAPLCLLLQELTGGREGPAKEQVKVRLGPAQGLADAPSQRRVRPAVPPMCSCACTSFGFLSGVPVEHFSMPSRGQVLPKDHLCAL